MKKIRSHTKIFPLAFFLFLFMYPLSLIIYPSSAYADTPTTFQIYVLDQTGKGVDGISFNVNDNGGAPKVYTSSGGGAILISTAVGHSIVATLSSAPFGIQTVTPNQIIATAYDYHTGSGGCGELVNSCLFHATTTTPTKFQTYVLNKSGGQGIDGVTLSITDTSHAGATKTFSQTSAGGGAIIINTYIGDSINETVTSATQLPASSLTPQTVSAAVYDYNTTSKPSCGELYNSCIISGNIPQLTLVLGLPGIGYNGPSGVTPKHLTRPVTVQVYDATVTNPSGPGTAPLTTTTGTVTFDSGSDSNAGYFVGKVPLKIPATPAANNQYKILVQVPQYLYQLALVSPPPSDSSQANIFTLTGDSVTTAPFVLFPGDVAISNGGLNHLTVDDYTQILACFNNVSDPTCTKTPGGILYADLDDNGVVDIVDINLWLRSLSQLIQAQAPGCATLDCQGD